VINRKFFTIVNVEDLAVLPANSEVTMASLMEAGIRLFSREFHSPRRIDAIS
jgi:large subunit ribosomal protein L15